AAIEYRFPGLIDGLALLAPGFCPQVRPAAERWRIAAARLFKPTQMFPIPLNDPALFTANPVWQEFIADDPLALREATARLLVESIKLDLYLKRAAPRINVPVLLLLAGKDRIIDNSRTRDFVNAFASAHKMVLEYSAAHHTLEFEPDPTRIFAELLAWIAEHATAHHAGCK